MEEGDWIRREAAGQWEFVDEEENIKEIREEQERWEVGRKKSRRRKWEWTEDGCSNGEGRVLYCAACSRLSK